MFCYRGVHINLFNPLCFKIALDLASKHIITCILFVFKPTRCASKNSLFLVLKIENTGTVMLDHLAAILEYPVRIANVPKGLENWTRGEKVEIYYLVGKGYDI